MEDGDEHLDMCLWRFKVSQAVGIVKPFSLSSEFVKITAGRKENWSSRTIRESHSEQETKYVWKAYSAMYCKAIKRADWGKSSTQAAVKYLGLTEADNEPCNQIVTA